MIAGLVVVAAAVLTCVCLCKAMAAGDRTCPVRPVPPLPLRRRSDLDGDPIWVLTPEQFRAAVQLTGLYPEAFVDLVARELATWDDPEHPDSAPDGDPDPTQVDPDHAPPADLTTTAHDSWFDRSPQVAKATEGAPS